VSIFVCGSTSDTSREFVNGARRSDTPVFSLPAALAEGAEIEPAWFEANVERAVASLQSQRRIVLEIGLPQVAERSISKKLAGHLIRFAQAVLRHVDGARIYVEGGATAVELARRMGWTRLRVLEEMAPGVATLAIEDSEKCFLTIKPGSYTWPETVRRLAGVSSSARR
jgi:uncharacterized protein YgbK (DUF1537 family)